MGILGVPIVPDLLSSRIPLWVHRVKFYCTELKTASRSLGNPGAGMPYYAVRSGRNTGIYNDWDNCRQNVSGYSGAQYAKFNTKEEASQYMSSQASKSEVTQLGGGRGGGPSGASVTASFRAPASGHGDGGSRNTTTSNTSGGYFDLNWSGSGGRGALPSNNSSSTSAGFYQDSTPSHTQTRSNVPERTVVYTDGACTNNGRVNPRAGYGVYFPDQPHKSSYGPLPTHERQTNQRAELTAVKEAIERAPKDRPLEIRSDSRYTIDCATKWGPNWEKQNWPESKKNVDLVKDIVHKSRTHEGGVSFTHVRGHSGEPGNEYADQLATRGAQMHNDHH